MQHIEFIKDIQSYNYSDAFIARLPLNIHSKEELLSQLSDKLNFPDYFGFNWDALFDCLRDFNWIEEKNIVLIHQDLPMLDNTDMRLYLNVLNDAVADWKEDDSHHLKVFFPVETEFEIKQLMASSLEKS